MPTAVDVHLSDVIKKLEGLQEKYGDRPVEMFQGDFEFHQRIGIVGSEELLIPVSFEVRFSIYLGMIDTVDLVKKEKP